MNTQDTATEYATEYATEVLALAKHLDCDPSELTEERHDYYGLPVYSLGSKEYAIGTDDKADDAWDQALDSYLDDCGILDSLPQNLRNYFDREAWKRDARFDGRGHALASYDGDECEVGEFYVYRIN